LPGKSEFTQDEDRPCALHVSEKVRVIVNMPGMLMLGAAMKRPVDFHSQVIHVCYNGAVEIDQLSVEVIDDIDFDGLFIKEYGSPSGERLTVERMSGNKRTDSRQHSLLASVIGYGSFHWISYLFATV
jgi:hypothetical protein